MNRLRVEANCTVCGPVKRRMIKSRAREANQGILYYFITWHCHYCGSYFRKFTNQIHKAQPPGATSDGIKQ